MPKPSNVLGFIDPVSAIAFDDIWPQGGAYIFAATAAIHNIVSTSALDAMAGAGAQTVEIEGLDVNYLPISEIVMMNGLTNVPTVNSYLRINRMVVSMVGGGGSNVGVIDAFHQNEGDSKSEIPIGFNNSQNSTFTVPAKSEGFLFNYSVSASIDLTFGIQWRMAFAKFGEPFAVDGFRASSSGRAADDRFHTYVKPRILLAKTDIKMQALGSQAGIRVTSIYSLLIQP